MVTYEFVDKGTRVSIGRGFITEKDLTENVVRMLIRGGFPPDKIIKKMAVYVVKNKDNGQILWEGNSRPIAKKSYIEIDGHRHTEWQGLNLIITQANSNSLLHDANDFERWLGSSIAGSAALGNKVFTWGKDPDNVGDKQILRGLCYQIHFNATSKAMLDRSFVPYDNSEKCTPFMENDVILDVFHNHKSNWENRDVIAIVSYQFKRKTGHTASLVAQKIAINHGRDAYGFQVRGVTTQPRALFREMVGGGGHIHGLQIAEAVLVERLGYKKTDLDLPCANAYSNFWFYKPEVFTQYVEKLLIPVCDLLKDTKDKELQELIFKDANYTYRTNSAGSKRPEDLKKIFGVPYYPYHPFFIERLPGWWLGINGFNVQLF